MKYSLYSRFKGTLIGGFIGEQFRHRETSSSGSLMLNYQLLEKLAIKGTIHPEEWVKLIAQTLALSENSEKFNTGELMLGILPLVVFFHDAPSLLEEQLNFVIIECKMSSEQQEELTSYSELLRLILTEKIPINDIIPHLLDKYSKSCSFFKEQLEQIQRFVKERATLTQVKAHFAGKKALEPPTIALAMYCFLGTPEDFGVSVRRAYQLRSPVIMALTGAIAGAYNSLLGIPPSWQLAWKTRPTSPKIEQTLVKFWARWMGIEVLDSFKLQVEQIAVASPLMMQKRPSRTIISQKF
ncbi:ADP-ribosylglycohydrolase family protein [Rippkaea orientalis]|nr:ADP-ribosylglycohydrolase family protein [Rippkaea orientalis]